MIIINNFDLIPQIIYTDLSYAEKLAPIHNLNQSLYIVLIICSTKYLKLSLIIKKEAVLLHLVYNQNASRIQMDNSIYAVLACHLILTN